MKYPQLVSMPSAVSDWLKEQLKARGIDSELYARLLLSLLHAHTRDLINPEDPYPSPPAKKDGGRSVAGHRRVRRAAHWWRNARLDPEQVKRSAAVECLMSAADQNCEVESLVDELCAKLKEIDSESSQIKISPKPSEDCKKIVKPQKVSTKELAEKYYAAFPPLNQKEGSYLTSNINLVVGKWPSPEKNLDKVDLIAAAKWTPGSPKKSKKKPKQRQTNEPNMKLSRNNRNRLGYRKSNCIRTLTREMEHNETNWEFVHNNNNNNNTKDRYSLITESSCLLEKNRVPKRVPDLFDHDLESFFDTKNLEELQSELFGSPDITCGFLQLGATVSKVWSPSRNICRLCNKPKSKHTDDLPAMNSFRYMEDSNLRQTGFGTIRDDRRFGHIIGGMEYDGPNAALSGTYFQHGDRWFEFVSCVSGRTQKKSYSFIDYLRTSTSNAFKKLQDEAQRGANMKPKLPKSAFARYTSLDRQPEDAYFHPGFQPYRSKFGKPVQGPPMPEHVRPQQSEQSNPEPAEDMWGSPDLYFRPIKSAREESAPVQKNTYPDGATFAINDNWDNIDFKKNEQGQLYVQCEDGKQKIYQHYRSESTGGTCDRFLRSSNKFNIKFEIKQNNKACQASPDIGQYVGLLTTIDVLQEQKPIADPTKNYVSDPSAFELVPPPTVVELAELAGVSDHNFIMNNILDNLLNETMVDHPAEEGNNESTWYGSHLKGLWANVSTEQIDNFNDGSDVDRLKKEATEEGDLLFKEISQQVENGTTDQVEVAVANETHLDDVSVNLQPPIRIPEIPGDQQDYTLFLDDCLFDLSTLPLRWLNLINR